MPRYPSPNNLSKFTLSLPSQYRGKMKELQIEIGAESWAEVVRRAVDLYHHVRVARQYKTIMVRDHDGERELIVL